MRENNNSKVLRCMLCNFVLMLFLFAPAAIAQNVIINNPDKPSVAIEIDSQEGGLLIPRLSDVQRDALPSPESGLLIFNLTTSRLNYWSGNAWFELLAMFETSTTGLAVFTNGMSVNNDRQDAEASSALDISSTTKGLLVSRTVPEAILNPEAGMLIFNTAIGKISFYNGATWITPNESLVSTSTGSGTSEGGGFTLSSTGTEGANSAMFDLDYTDKALLLPRLSDMQRNSIDPANGLIIYNNSSNSIQYYTAEGWYAIPSSVPQPSVITGEVIEWQLASTTYSVVSVPGTSYSWTVPAGWTITAGQGTNQITVTIGETSGIVEVVPVVGGINGPSRTLQVDVKRAFKSTWKTSNTVSGGSAANQLSIPMYGNGYNFTVYWGDGSSQVYSANPGATTAHNLVKTYAASGNYTIYITGEFPRIYFNNGKERLKLLSINQWGDIVWASMGSAFYGCTNFDGNFVDTPNLTNVTDLSNMFRGAHLFNWDIGNWDVSHVTNMQYMFQTALVFNKPIGNWNVSNVTNMGYMFSGAYSFNQAIGNWNVSNVTKMNYMFNQALVFNQPIGNWDVGHVTDMNYMFGYTNAFNQPIGNWNVSNVTKLSRMFYAAYKFNQPIGNWDVSKVTLMTAMFFEAIVFNQDLSGWCVSLIPVMPDEFDESAVAWTLPRPIWGTCP